MKILVTGGAGYIGSTVTGLLAEKGNKAVVYDNLSHGRRDLLPAGAEFVEGELSDRAHFERIFAAARDAHEPFDAVLHFAALIEAGESMQRPEIYFRNNTASTLSLLEAMLACGPRRLVFSSTAAVYGEPEVTPIQEDARLAPTNAYGQSKLLVEQMLVWLHRIHGLQYASLRYFNVAGAAEGPEGIVRGESHQPETHLIPLVLDVALGLARCNSYLRRRLSDAGRNLHSRLHSRLGSGRRALAGTRSVENRCTRGRRRATGAAHLQPW